MKQQSNKLLWVDLEMTGLNPGHDRIIEVAAVVTDFDFQELDTYKAAIAHANDLVLPLFEDSPFWTESPQAYKQMLEDMATGVPEQTVQRELCGFIAKHFEEPAILAGNSIHQDRRFIRQWWPDVEKMLHYRMLDVSSFKIIMEQRGHRFEKQEKHRALDDIRESIAELKFYLEKLSG